MRGVLLVFAMCACSLSVQLAGSAAPTSSGRGIDPTVVKRELADILARQEYSRVYHKSWVDRGIEWVGGKIEQFIAWLGRILGFGRLRGVGGVASALLAWAVVLGFIVSFARLIARLSAQVGPGGKAAARSLADACDIPSAGPLIREAEAMAASGDYRAAFRLAYLASIAHLDEAKALRFERSRTNWECLRELTERGRNELRDELRPLTLAFDRKVYGSEPCRLGDYESALALYRRIAQEAAV